ncbi:carboxypeptidase regulatory-like domain-containing protein [Nibrella saemangeumensis]
MNDVRYLRRLFLVVGLLYIGISSLLAQTTVQTTTLTGRVTDAATGEGLPFANVFINATTKGTTTDEQGRYRLTGVPLGTVELVASYLGYQPANQSLRLESTQTREVNLALTSTGVTLDAVTVTVKKDKTWQRQMRTFERELLGGGPFGRQCEITNSHVVTFTEYNGHLKAEVSEPLVIENKALGYRLRYEMQHFDYNKTITYYGGNSRFEEMQPENPKQAERWRLNRLVAYEGSLRHLMASLVAGNFEQEGFLVYQVNPSIMRTMDRPTLLRDVGRRLQPVSLATLIQPGRLSFERRLVSAAPLEIFYTKINSRTSPYSDVAYAWSQMALPQRTMEMTADGWITLPNGMEVKGYLGNERLGSLLPADWKPEVKPAVNSEQLAGEGQVLAADRRQDSLSRAWTQNHTRPTPAVYVQTDKSLYATGDRLWLSAYVLDAVSHRKLDGEDALHIDLVSPDGKVIQHQWLRVADGRATGDFRFSDTLATGTYRLRAYIDEERVLPRPAFERTLSVYNLVRSTFAGKALNTDSLDVQFLPEGGQWVGGLSTRLGFKVVGRDGLGKTVSGRIVDEQGNELVSFTSNAVGIGSVLVTPQAGRSYRADVPAGTVRQTVALPPVAAEGLVLTADMVSDTHQLVLRVQASERYRSQPVYLAVQSRGLLLYQARVQLQDGKARLFVPAAKLPEGIAQVTLLNAQGHPQAERLVFVPERIAPVAVKVVADKSEYKPRERVRLDLKLNDAFNAAPVGFFSVAITDAGQLPDDSVAADIRTHLLLTGDLRGRVEQPNRYFTSKRVETRRALDDLLLTQGWRRISWIGADAVTDTIGGIVLNGRVLDEKQKPIPYAELLISSLNTRPSFSKSVGADRDGLFRLNGLAFADTARLVAQIMDPRLKPLKGKIVPEKPEALFARSAIRTQPPDWSLLKGQLEAAQLRQQADPELYRDKQAKLLKEVVVRGFKPAERPAHVQRVSIHNSADATLLFDEKSPRFGNLYDMLIGRIAGVQVTRGNDPETQAMRYQVTVRGIGSFISSTQPLFLMDGVPIEDPDGNALMPFNPNDIERIEVLKNGGTAGIYGVRGGNGVIAFYTKRTVSEVSKEPGKGVSAFSLIGFSAQREFYTPRYGSEAPDLNDRIDRRDVLYWKPLMQTDSKGQSGIAFPLSDVVRTLRVVVQGITADGRPVSGTTLIKVQ